MEAKKGVIEGEVPLEDSKSRFTYLVKLEDGVSVEASSENSCKVGDNVRVVKISHVPATFKIFKGDE